MKEKLSKRGMEMVREDSHKGKIVNMCKVYKKQGQFVNTCHSLTAI